MRTLLIDNYDSFTYNLHQLLWEVTGEEPTVVRNDAAAWGELSRAGFEAVVLSPGPGRPERRRDFGVCAEVIRDCDLPLLGVCLGHQGLGWVNGGEVVRAPQPMHGRVRSVEHAGSALFAGIPRRFQAVRYHSLCLAQPLPSALERIAWSEDGVTMAVAHRRRPRWGVQFHPESVAGEHGRCLLANFRNLASARRPHSSASRGSLFVPDRQKEPRDAGGQGDTAGDGSSDDGPRLRWRRLYLRPDPEALFAALYGDSSSAFWLDSSRTDHGARFSFMGDASGPLGMTLRHHVDAAEELLFDRLDRELRRLRPAEMPELPFDFACGFAGYLGYELKAECGAAAAHRSPHPDAQLVFADRMLALDHALGHAYLLCLHQRGAERQADDWLATTTSRIAALADAAPSRESGGCLAEPPRCCSDEPPPGSLEIRFRRSRAQYLEDIARCEELLRDGESYEICLTNEISTRLATEPFDLYRRLRRVNPAPHAAYLRFGELAVLSSSPERFLAIDRDGGVEARPIKGTSRRDSDPREDALLAARLAGDEKNRAENLMIVDLIRNDLGSVCEMGSVEVPSLMAVESFETVHQLVSTVRGRLRAGLGAADCIRACFPPGSMTGAPKLRTTEILDELEGAARGVYSGAIGYLGLGGGCDLSVAIRTIVLDGETAGIGAGGAIVLGSDPEAEYEEMLLKAAAALRAIDPGLDPTSISLTDQRRGAGVSPPASVPDLTS